MAVYKGREVKILGRLDGEDVSPTYRVLDQWGQEELVELSQLHITKDEEKDIKNDSSLLKYSIIEDKDLQNLRDSQDPEKIKARQDKEAKDMTPVAVATKEVPAKEVKNK